MYLLDTNVVSELRKVRLGKADANMAAWARRASGADWYLSAIGLMEIEQGVLRMERRDPVQGQELRRWLDQTVKPSFFNYVLPFDAEAAVRCAALHVPNPRPERDAMIAATGLVHGLTVVTRNTADFVSTGVQVVNPWLP